MKSDSWVLQFNSCLQQPQSITSTNAHSKLNSLIQHTHISNNIIF